ncbi:hypothetical protein M0812_26206 [Anaeramoeba flamelloides]|uniref:Uncharacterized protein n=1 Tax=Anaeramoeba flamelloides TaxID=1746091 RepID=A0AAV7YGN7_9EUKA|nr:hypothetical protein M0812_26206 [Anaeramoeba flamelloides]
MEIMVGILSLNYKSNTKTAKVSHKYEKLVNALSKIENFNSISLQEQERMMIDEITLVQNTIQPIKKQEEKLSLSKL